jgi:hypothetical protein
LVYELFRNGFGFRWLVRIIADEIFELPSVDSSFFVNDFEEQPRTPGHCTPGSGWSGLWSWLTNENLRIRHTALLR